MRFVMADSPFNIIFRAFFRAFRKGEKTQYYYTIFKAQKQATLREMPLNRREVTVLPQTKAHPTPENTENGQKRVRFCAKCGML